jgi:hypothetical protein
MAERVPHVPPILVRWLREIFPDTLPTEPESKSATAFRIGQQDVIRKLAHEMERQQNNIIHN